MTPDMAFECLLVSRDPDVVCTLNRVLDKFSICTKLCMVPGRAANLLREGSTDLVVIDWDDDLAAAELLKEIREWDSSRKQTIVAVTPFERRIPGAHLVLKKPMSTESSTNSMKFVYSRMLQDHRRHARYAVMTSVVAKDGIGRSLPLIVTNIGDGGIGVSCREELTIGDILSFKVSLPGARRPIYVEARVLWTRDYGISGCEFVRIPPVDVDILHDWLKSRCQVRKPLIPV